MDYAKRVEELLRMPQELCIMCGLCCKVATFKGGLAINEIRELANDYTNPSQAEGAKDFLTLFRPISPEEAEVTSPEFVGTVTARFEDPERKKKVGFFRCVFVGDHNLCLIHEDRPMLCRMYPIPHERTIYHSICGFKETGEKNWQEIKKIIDILEEKSQNLQTEE